MATGRYVPPHMRNRGPAPPGPAPPSPSTSTSRYTPSQTGAHSQRDASSPRGHARPLWSNGDREREPRSDININRADRADSLNPRGPAPTLHVFGDSFAGPFKLLDSGSARVRSFKGASAKGLNNPKSIKQVSNDLVPLLNQLLAPPPYAYLPPAGRYALLLFGNVDLQINYLWQLQHKPIVPATWDEHIEYTEEESAISTPAENLLASATETVGRGPALGPERFVDNVTRAYMAWLEREVVNGPIGRRAAEVAAQANGENRGVRRLAPTKVLVGAALPPLIQDDTLPQIPGKYVERLEEDHAKAQRALERGSGGTSERISRTPWAKVGSSPTLGVEEDLAKVSLNGGASPADSAPKVSVADLIAHDPALCTKTVRIAMTNRFNASLRDFCAKHPTMLEFVDIADDMLAADAAERESTGDPAPEIAGEVDRAVWACPVDLSNIHPLWEPTLPLWLKKLQPIGVPTDSFTYAADAEETMRAYEEDKKRRMNKADNESRLDGGDRIKLRDE
ncbi:uncharacterized protein CcaverHIS019_0505200 [Cutaneotrichosporon cavernicola]|uniref:Uncharacterized protein n=1 Tax=Cutaneotrichosporon cavernicola TaxID=279322 RepID=A0AA48L6J8_9TREE|nr:uncharacterized protein CcaverHIS019_0505200 [Cutaneotrichosporon cavernicola]BEI92892.1 hypothetical protein CcaverHIS019_0505200 [Cutaneotrichosporon cavernicola]BEJ00668.1 hypothetical protein CcaverHIS631_0505250 [Cutaneotrichosporon cavernicola]